MYTVIRRYTGVTDTAEVVRRATEEFGPMLADRPGFQGYYVVDTGSDVIASISVFETQQQAEDSTTAAAGWVQDRLAEFMSGEPQVTAGSTTGVPAAASA